MTEADYRQTIKLENTVRKIQIYRKLDTGEALAFTEDGFLVYFQNSEIYENEIYEAKLIDFNKNFNSFYATDLTLLHNEEPIDLIQAYREYLYNTSFLIRNERKASTENKYHQSVYRSYFLLLLVCLEQKSNYIEDEKEQLLYYFFIALLAGVLKSTYSFKYNEKLERYKFILNLEQNTTLEGLREYLYNLDDETIGQTKIKAINNIVDCLDTEIIDIQLPLQPNSPVYELKKLVESYNLIKKVQGDYMSVEPLISKSIKQILINPSDIALDSFRKLLSDTEEEIEVSMNLGREDKYKEFKSSFFYSASDKPQEDVILREIAGFLNAYEGTGHLYLGVDDSGDIIGLDNDLKYDSKIKNIDQYQNHIQSKIVSAFPKIINAVIEYKVHTRKDKDYLEIIIPSYESPIPLKGEFYQRQGIQTRILKGEDILDFFNKKSGIKSILPDIVEEFRDPLIISGNEGTQLDLYSEFKEEPKELSNKDISTKDSSGLLAYLYIYDTNNYVVSLKEDLSDYKYKIEITEQYKKGYLLMCYENGCINKVEIRSILNKTPGKVYKNAYNRESRIMALSLANDNDKIIIHSGRSNKEYIKSFDIDRISDYRHLFLKGNCILQDDFDNIFKFKTSPRLPEEFNIFHRKSKSGLGVTIDQGNETHREMKNWMYEQNRTQYEG